MFHYSFISSTDSAIDVEAEFQHDLKPRKKRRRKRTHLSLNQSRKKKKTNTGKVVKIINVDTDDNEEKDIGTTNSQIELNELEPNLQENVNVHSVNFQESSVETEQNLCGANVNDSIQSEEEISENYVTKCIRECKDTLIQTVVENFDKEGLLVHFMAFMNMICTGQLSVMNIAVLLSMEVALLLSLASTTQMRYRNETALFWEVVLAVGGPRTLRLFSSDKHMGLVNTGECKKSKYEPSKGNFNFAVPDEKILRKSRTGLSKEIPCGIIHDSIKLLDRDKEYVLSLDGKQTSPGLINESEGDVNLWGFEGPPSLQENLDRIRLQEKFIAKLVQNASSDENALNTFAPDIKVVVHLITKRIRGLREAKVRYEQLRSRFQKKIRNQPDIGSRYSVAFSDIECFLRRANLAIEKLLRLNLDWCEIMSKINGNHHCFRRNGPVSLDSTPNSWILRHPDTLQLDNFLIQHPHFLKQKSDLWMETRKRSSITGSTMFSALGMRTLKEQRKHIQQYVEKKDIISPITPAMEHGTSHEVFRSL